MVPSFEGLYLYSGGDPVEAGYTSWTAVLKHDERSTAIYRSLGVRFTQDPKLVDLADQAIVDLMNEAKACLKPLQRMLVERDKRAENAGDVIQKVAEGLAPDMIGLGELEGKDRPTLPRMAPVRHGLGRPYHRSGMARVRGGAAPRTPGHIETEDQVAAAKAVQFAIMETPSAGYRSTSVMEGVRRFAVGKPGDRRQ